MLKSNINENNKDFKDVKEFKNNNITYDSTYYNDANYMNFRDLSSAQVDFLEMARQCERINILGQQLYTNITNLIAAASKLAGLVGCSFDANALTNFNRNLQSEIAIITGTMKNQIDSYSALNEEIAYRLSSLSALASQLYDDNGMIVRMMDPSGNEIEVNFNEIIEFYNSNPDASNQNMLKFFFGDQVAVIAKDNTIPNEVLKKVFDKYDKVDFEDIINHYDNSPKQTNIYDYIMKNRSQDMETLGVQTGEDFLNAMLEYFKSQKSTQREKLVSELLGYHAFCHENNISIDYSQDIRYNTRDLSHDNKGIAADCSSYVYTWISDVFPDFYDGTGSTTYSLTSSKWLKPLDSYKDMLPGDIVLSNSHTMIFVGMDKDNEYVFASAENPTNRVGLFATSEKYLSNNGLFPKRVNYPDDSFDYAPTK